MDRVKEAIQKGNSRGKLKGILRRKKGGKWGEKKQVDRNNHCCGHHCFEHTSIPKIQPKHFITLGLEQFLNFGTLSFFLY